MTDIIAANKIQQFFKTRRMKSNFRRESAANKIQHFVKTRRMARETWNYEEYLHLCYLLTSRDPRHNYRKITHALFNMLKIKAIDSTRTLMKKNIKTIKEGTAEEIKKLGSIYEHEIQKLKLREKEKLDRNNKQMDKIFENIEEIFKKQNRIDPSDNNYIGYINLISLQCVIAFTIRYFDEGNTLDDEYDSEDETSGFDSIFLSKWTNYKILKTIIIKERLLPFLVQEKGREYTLENIEDPNMRIFFVRWIDKFSSDEIIRNIFSNVEICEIKTKKSMADGFVEDPLSFLMHDIEHGTDDFCVKRYSPQQMEVFFNFYKHCADTLSRKDFRKIRLYVFIELHESEECRLDPSYYRPSPSHRIDEETSKILKRLYNKHDLQEMIPENILKMHFSIREYEIRQYYFECVNLYHKEYLSWRRKQLESPDSLGGKRSSIKRQ